MFRREFIKRSLQISALTVFNKAWGLTPLPPAVQADVIIIGAGIAGLSAAKILKNKGLSVLILEARGRIGGRIWTDKSLGFPVDLGASWIHGINKNPIKQLADQFHIKTVPTNYNASQVYHPNGKLHGGHRDNRRLFRLLSPPINRRPSRPQNRLRSPPDSHPNDHRLSLVHVLVVNRVATRVVSRRVSHQGSRLVNPLELPPDNHLRNRPDYRHHFLQVNQALFLLDIPLASLQ